MFDARIEYTSDELTPALVAANTSAEQSFTNIPKVDTGDMVLSVNKPTAQAGLGIVGVRVVGAGEIAITFANFTAVGITPTAAQTYHFALMKRQPV